MHYGAMLFGVLTTMTAFIANAAVLDEAERLGNEITNLRALPFGFAAWCEDGILRMDREGGARFRVSDSAICRLVPDGDFVCTADPHRETQPNSSPVGHCHELRTPEADDAI